MQGAGCRRSGLASSAVSTAAPVAARRPPCPLAWTRPVGCAGPAPVAPVVLVRGPWLAPARDVEALAGLEVVRIANPLPIGAQDAPVGLAVAVVPLGDAPQRVP